jgi:hypothetical protein
MNSHIDLQDSNLLMKMTEIVTCDDMEGLSKGGREMQQ